MQDFTLLGPCYLPLEYFGAQWWTKEKGLFIGVSFNKFNQYILTTYYVSDTPEGIWNTE